MLTAQIGLMTMAWASLEATLDAAINMVHRHGGSVHIQPDLPASLKVKLAYLRKMPRQIAILSHLNSDVQRLVDGIQGIKDFRHDLTHGIIAIGEPGMRLAVTRFAYRGAKLEYQFKEFEQVAINEAASKVVELNLDAACIAVCFAKALGESEFENAFSELAISAALSVKLGNQTGAVVN